MLVEKGKGYRITIKSTSRNSYRPIDWMVCVGGVDGTKHNLRPKGPVNLNKSQAIFLTKEDAIKAAKECPYIQAYLKTLSGMDKALYYLDIVPTRKEYVAVQVPVNHTDVPVYVNVEFAKRRLDKHLPLKLI